MTAEEGMTVEAVTKEETEIEIAQIIEAGTTVEAIMIAEEGMTVEAVTTEIPEEILIRAMTGLVANVAM